MPIPLRRQLFAGFLLASSFILLTCSPSAYAQIPNGDLFFGFSRTGSDTFYPNVGALNGWEAGGYLKIRKPFLGVEGDVAHYGLGANSSVPRTTTALFGPRFTLHASGFAVFVHGLVGGEHSANSGGPTPISGGALAYALGGGLDVPLAPFFAWRIQGDRLSAPSLSPSGGTPARFTTGIVFRF